MRSKLAATAAGALAASIVIGGIAVAAVPGSDGVIQGCYLKSKGTLRVIDAEAGQACHATKELALSWNERGTPGQPGAAGPPGPQGEREIPVRPGLRVQPPERPRRSTAWAICM